MRAMMFDERYGDDDRDTAGDLRGLLAMLDEPTRSAPVEEGFHRLLSSIAMTRNRQSLRH